MEHAPKKHAPRFVKLSDIKPGHHGYNVYVKVLAAKPDVAKKQDQSELKIVEGRVGDSTAVINVRVVGEYADLFKVGNVLAIRNGRSEVFKEHHRLELDRWGKVTLESDHDVGSVKESVDMSATSYETRLVAKSESKK